MPQLVLPLPFVLLLVFTTSVFGTESAEVEIIDVKMISDTAPHSAFTDLIRFQDNWFCVFREGKAHVSRDGALQVLKSHDGNVWQSVARLTSPDADLRDAKITITPTGQLMLCGAAALHQPAEARHQSMIWYSDNGTAWSDAIAIGPPDYWIWRISWHDGKAYGVGYHTIEPRETQLFVSGDGHRFEKLGEPFSVDGFSNEASLIFHTDGTALCVVRRDGTPDDAQLGKSVPPYTDWKWQSLGQYIGGPALKQMPDGRHIIAGRRKTGPAKTVLWQLDPTTAKLSELAVLPSGGDTSYPGLVLHDDILWMSYYSSHEGKTRIYLAKIKLPTSK
ncbi:hypothetical protein Pan97_43670 [Bremerella volcania]|uniref:BNR/Asp-box repeat protein n=1 Tax=Bremerella volcania TaxID=2527984 RepID=A0A518CDJ8_9BACT|nr:exo-alpha-sialidase [Bremerella volcania]QDU77300.1 hypothetical protein Pan97_43670 [Bremerella volcania]